MPLPVAASVSMARVLTGPVRTVTVLASLETALYLSTLDPDTPALCLAAASAVRVPCALVLGPGVPVPGAPVGSSAWLGEGELRLAGGTSAVVTRWWRPYAVRRTAVATVSAPLTGLEPLSDELAVALSSGEALDDAVRALLGRGPGLTPLGDDVLAGVLVTLTALGSPAARALSAAVRTALQNRATTPVSAALLTHAGRGECIPQLAAVLAGGPTDELLSVGSSSGGGLLLGVQIGLRVGRTGACQHSMSS
jgi:hypothetical protein